MDSNLGGGQDDQERLSRFLAWRRKEKRTAQTPASAEKHANRLLSYASAVAWLGIGVLTVGLVTTLTVNYRPRRAPVAETLRSTASEVTGTVPAVVPPVTAEPEKPEVSSRRAVNIPPAQAVAYSRPTRSEVIGRRGPAAAGIRRRETAAPPVAPSRLTTTVKTVVRWVAYIPEVRTSKAIVRWVKSQPPPPGQRPPERERPQAR